MNAKMHKDMDSYMSTLKPPAMPLPRGAWDVHSHVFGPYEAFPLAASAVYQPPLAPYEQYIEMLDRTGFAHGVLVHPSAMGFDNAAMLDALKRSNGRLRGVAVVPVDTSDKELAAMHQAGVRGLRFTMSRQMAAATTGVLNLEDLRVYAPRLRDLGWHAQIWAPADIIAENIEFLRSLHLPIVLDHMGQFEVAKGVNDAGFQSIVNLARDGIVWVKTTAFRNSKVRPAMEDVRPFHERLVKVAGGQLLWGSDWPFIGMGDAMPEMAQLVAQLRNWSGDAVFDQILVQNPRALYAR